MGTANYSDTVVKFLADCEIRNRPETVRQYRGYLEAFTTRKNSGEITRSDILKQLGRYRNRDGAYLFVLDGEIQVNDVAKPSAIKVP